MTLIGVRIVMEEKREKEGMTAVFPQTLVTERKQIHEELEPLSSETPRVELNKRTYLYNNINHNWLPDQCFY